MEYQHITVLKEATVDPLVQNPGGLYVDGTLGGGGHLAHLLLNKPDARVIGLDRDAEAIQRVGTRFQKECASGQLQLFQESFANLDLVLSKAGIQGVDGVMLDLGFSSFQVDDPLRGFSFVKDGPLDMRMDKEGGLTAADIIAGWGAEDLVRIFREYGEERFAKRIADRIVRERMEKPITRTPELTELILSAIPGKFRHGQRIHPATRVFQALRIAVNEELQALEKFLTLIPGILNPGGVASIISFHSLEDRLVKQRFRYLSDDCICPPTILSCARCHKPPAIQITKKPIQASEAEIEANPRSRSAKLRILRRAAAANGNS